MKRNKERNIPIKLNGVKEYGYTTLHYEEKINDFIAMGLLQEVVNWNANSDMAMPVLCPALHILETRIEYDDEGCPVISVWPHWEVADRHADDCYRILFDEYVNAIAGVANDLFHLNPKDYRLKDNEIKQLVDIFLDYIKHIESQEGCTVLELSDGEHRYHNVDILTITFA